MFEALLVHFNYLAALALTVIGLYIVMASGNLLKQLIGLAIFQTSVFVLYISVSVSWGATEPIISAAPQVLANPLPHVLILTAIVVGVATAAVGFALIVRIHEAFGSVDEDEIDADLDR